MKKLKFLGAALVALAFGFAIPIGVRGVNGHQHAETGRMVASWRFPAVSLQQLTHDADLIAVVRATAVRPGRVVASDKGESTYQFELVDFAVTQVMKGTPPATITVERGADVQNKRNIVSHDGGPYARNTQHLLFLKEQPGTSYYLLMNDQGRFVVGQDGRLDVVRRGPVSDELREKPLPEAVGLIERLARMP